MGRKSKYSKEEKIALVEKYLNDSCSINSLAKAKGIHWTTFRDWIRIYQSIGSDGFNSEKNQRYPETFKRQVVQEYFSQKGSLEEICKKFKIKSTRQLRSWISKYNNHESLKAYAGGTGKVMVEGRKTTLEERIDIVKDYIESGSSYEEIAEKYQISYQQIYQWVRKYQEHGIDGLVDRRGRRKDHARMTETEKLRAELKMEKAKNKRLEMENLFLKKLEEIERRRY